MSKRSAPDAANDEEDSASTSKRWLQDHAGQAHSDWAVAKPGPAVVPGRLWAEI